MQHIVVLARTGSYVRAAQELQITESALSRSIQTIEDQFSTRLFDRDYSGARPTPNGRAIAAEAERLLREAEEFTRKLAAQEDGSAGYLAFGFAPHATPVLLPRIMLDLINNFPLLRFRAEVKNAEALIEMLLRGDVEVVICGDGRFPEGLPVDAIPFDDIRVGYLVRRGHPLAGRSEVELSDVRKYRAVGRIQGDQTTNVGAFDNLHASCEDFDSLLAATLGSDVIWVGASMDWLKDRDKYGLAELPPIKDSEGGDEHRIYAMKLLIVTAQNRTLSSQAKLFIERVRVAERL